MPTINGSTTAFIVLTVFLVLLLILICSLLIFLLVRYRSRSPRRRHSNPNNTTSSNIIGGWIQTESLEWDPYDIDRPDSEDPPRTSQSPFRVREPQSTTTISPVSIAMEDSHFRLPTSPQYSIAESIISTVHFDSPFPPPPSSSSPPHPILTTHLSSSPPSSHHTSPTRHHQEARQDSAQSGLSVWTFEGGTKFIESL